VTLTWPWEESEGEKEKRVRHDGRLPFETEAGEAGEGGSGVLQGVGRRVESTRSGGGSDWRGQRGRCSNDF
jgi:hypothetical protein